LKFNDAQTVLLFGRQKFQFFLTLLLLRPEKIRETWDFRFFLPLYPCANAWSSKAIAFSPPKGETQIFANIEMYLNLARTFSFI